MNETRRRNGTLYKRDKIYWTRFRVKGLDVRSSTGTQDKEKAEEVFVLRGKALRTLLGLKLPEEASL